MKILQITTIARTHEAFLTPWVRHFRGLGWTVDGVANGITRSHPCVQAYDHVWDVGWSRNPLAISEYSKAMRDVRDIVRANAYDIVHVHTPVAAFLTRLALRHIKRTGHPVVIYTAHGFHFHSAGGPLRNGVYLFLERLAGKWTDQLVVMNSEDHAAAQKCGIVAPSNIHFIPGVGIDTQEWAPERVSHNDRQQVRREMGLTDGETLFLVVAELNPGKRHKDALIALKLARNQAIHLAIAGEGRERGRLERLAATLGLRARVHFLGNRRDIPNLIAASTATILPSEREGLPRSMLESLALGVPVIGAKVRGIQDILQYGGGVLFPLGDVGELARHITWFAEHPTEARLMGEVGRRAVVDLYEQRQVVHAYAELYLSSRNAPHQ